jgi:hypothetical protein
VADSLSLSWRRQLTAVAHKRYLKHNNFYAVSQLAGMQVRAKLRMWQVLYVIHVVTAFTEGLIFLDLKVPQGLSLLSLHRLRDVTLHDIQEGSMCDVSLCMHRMWTRG